MGQMKRNYESLSHFQAKDSQEYSKLRNMKEEYEKKVLKLTYDNELLEAECKAAKVKVGPLEEKLKDTEKKLGDKTKDYDKLLEQFKKKDKVHDDKVASLNSKYPHFF